MLLKEALIDGWINKYDCIILDEVHERTVDTDILLGILKHLMFSFKKQNKKLILMSATINFDIFIDFFTKTAGDSKENMNDY